MKKNVSLTFCPACWTSYPTILLGPPLSPLRPLCHLFGQLAASVWGFMAFGVSVSLLSGNVIKITTGHAHQKARVENLNKM